MTDTDRNRTIGGLRTILGKTVDSDNYIVLLRESDRQAIEDAIALLRSGSWLLTLEEALEDESVYVEFKGSVGTIQAWCLFDKGEKVTINAEPMWHCSFYRDDYMVTWRCWNKRPTAEQREQTPWKETMNNGDNAD